MLSLPEGLTRKRHFASIPVLARGSTPARAMRAWTRETTLVAEVLFVREEGFYPGVSHLHSREWMPSLGVVQRWFQTLKGYRDAYVAATGLQAARHPTSAYAARIPCLRCDALFASPDRREIRLCAWCHDDPTLSEGLWLGGVPIREGMTLEDVWELA